MATQQAPPFEKGKLYDLPIIDIKPDPDQPRKYMDPQALEEMAASVKQLGILQPVLFRQGEQGDVILVAGERRFAAAKKAGLLSIYLAYADETIWRQVVAKLPRGVEAGDAEMWPQAVAKLTNETVMEFLPQVVAEIPWGHHRLILDKITDPAALLYYLRATDRSADHRRAGGASRKERPMTQYFHRYH
jgi:hypothetical protein